MNKITYRRGWWCTICDAEIAEARVDAFRCHLKVVDGPFAAPLFERHATYSMIEETTTDEDGKPWVVTMIGPSPELLATLGLGEAS